MKRLLICACALLMAAPMAPAFAQDDDNDEMYIYSTYYYCDATRLDDVDALMKKMAPLYDEAVESGDLANWGWGRHHTGGKWKRFFFGAGTDPVELMKTLSALNEKSEKIEGSENFNAICGNHEDYLWRSVASSPESAVSSQGTIGVSQYMKCNMNDEGFADYLVKNHLSKVFNAHVGEGQLTSWTWGAHQVGGEYRRLLAMRAASLEDMMGTWGSIVETMREEHGNPLRRFTDACPAHVDYIWMTGK